MRLKNYYGPPEVEQGLIDAILRGERPQGMGPEFILDDDGNPYEPGKMKPVRSMSSASVGPRSGMMPKYTMRGYQ